MRIRFVGDSITDAFGRPADPESLVRAEREAIRCGFLEPDPPCIKLGLNDLGVPAAHYHELVTAIRESCPDAIIRAPDLVEVVVGGERVMWPADWKERQ